MISLSPYSWILEIRHYLYDKGIMKSSKTPVPSICVGNIKLGGTGKTPHTEMILRLMSSLPQWEGRHFSVLSRGYKRKSKGYQLLKAEGPTHLYGDEPMQIKRKFPWVSVAVDRHRAAGAKRLCEEEKVDLIILDDAFQHRAIQANVNVVLVDYNRPFFRDGLVPFGHLRDLKKRVHAADIVIVAKCPSYIIPAQEEEFKARLKFLGPVFFTTMGYDAPTAVFPEGNPRYTHSPRAILLTGIANPKPLFKYLNINFKILRHFAFADHHWFNKRNINMLLNAVKIYPDAVIFTTEKDAQRILDCKNVPLEIRERLFAVPIRVEFMNENEEIRFKDTLIENLC